MSFATEWLSEIGMIASAIDESQVEMCTKLLLETKQDKGRVFVLGVGGSAANASHFVNDLRKIARIEAYAPTDNAAELTARTNDHGWHTVFEPWLKVSHLNTADLVFVLSVGGGSSETSANLICAIEYATLIGARTAGIVGRISGYTQRMANACIIVPSVNEAHVTPHAESFQSVLCHLLVWHPLLRT